MILDNCYDSATAMRNAEEFVKNRVDLVIEFQVEQEAAPVIADKIAAAKIPLIAIDIPHPHATYFGVDNYRVGFEAGEVLAAHALKLWDGRWSGCSAWTCPKPACWCRAASPGHLRACAAASPIFRSNPSFASTGAECATAAANSSRISSIAIRASGTS